LRPTASASAAFFVFGLRLLFVSAPTRLRRATSLGGFGAAARLRRAASLSGFGAAVGRTASTPATAAPGTAPSNVRTT
jgi:hypothetical protein